MDNVLLGPWPAREKPRRSLAALSLLAGGMSDALDVACEKRKPVDASLLTALGAKMECFASLAKSLSDEARTCRRYADAATLDAIASTMEHRAASIALDLEIFE